MTCPHCRGNLLDGRHQILSRWFGELMTVLVCPLMEGWKLVPTR